MGGVRVDLELSGSAESRRANANVSSLGGDLKHPRTTGHASVHRNAKNDGAPTSQSVRESRAELDALSAILAPHVRVEAFRPRGEGEVVRLLFEECQVRGLGVASSGGLHGESEEGEGEERPVVPNLEGGVEERLVRTASLGGGNYD